MTDAATDTEYQPPPPPGEAQRAMLRVILAMGNTAFLDADEHVVAGTPAKPGPRVGTALQVVQMLPFGLMAGERGLLMVTRAGRHFAATGDLVTDEDITTTDVDLAAWAKGEVDYITAEVLEAIDSRFARVVTTRREALGLLLQERVATEAEATPDVDSWHDLPTA
jgi:hypothetical protein